MKKYIVFDIDGTLARVDPTRLKHLRQDKPDWDAFYEGVENDGVYRDVAELMGILRIGYDLILCTGRREAVREKTVKWLYENLKLSGFSYKLLMRPDGNFKHDTEVKPDLLESASIYPFNTVAIFEDRNTMVAKWRDIGFTVMHVADGNF